MLFCSSKSSQYFLLSDNFGMLYKYGLIKCVCACMRVRKVLLPVNQHTGRNWSYLSTACCFSTHFLWMKSFFFPVEQLIRTVSQNCSAKKTQERRRQGEITGYALLQSSGLCLCACVKQTDAVWHRDRSDRKRLCLWVTVLPASVYTWVSMPIFVWINPV